MKLKKHISKFILLLLITVAWSCQDSQDLEIGHLDKNIETRSTPCLIPMGPLVIGSLAADKLAFPPFVDFNGYLDCLYQEYYPSLYCNDASAGEEVDYCCQEAALLFNDLEDIKVAEMQKVIKRAHKFAISNAPSCSNGDDKDLTNIDFYIEYRPNPIIGGPLVPYIGFYAKYYCCNLPIGD